MTRPRVLLVDHSREVSGAERSMLAGLAAPGDRGRFDFVVACPPGGSLEHELHTLAVPMEPVELGRLVRPRDLRNALRHAGGFAAGLRGLPTVLRRVRPSIIHANTTQAALSTALVAGTTPMIWHVRDLVDLGLVGRWLYRRSDAVIAISHAVAREVFPHRTDDRKLHVIHNGIDADGFRKEVGLNNPSLEFNLSTDAVRVAVVGQLTPWKGHDVLLDAWREVRREVPRAALLMVGSALWKEDRAWETWLKHRADQLGLHGSVRFVGRRPDVARIMAGCRCVVIPSRSEPFGRVALEAMALEKPVVGAAAGGLVEVVENGVTGLLVKPGDAPALARALIQVLNDEKSAARMGQTGSVRVREKFDLSRTQSLIQEVYDQTLHRRERVKR